MFDPVAVGRVTAQLQMERDEREDAAQQFFEASVYHYKGSLTQRAVWVTTMLMRWPWLRPNKYQVLNEEG